MTKYKDVLTKPVKELTPEEVETLQKFLSEPVGLTDQEIDELMGGE